jgi:hypothetical membrane protein
VTRQRWGALVWVLGLLTFPAQAIAAAQWPQPYSWSTNFISDLGVTTCSTFELGSSMERYVCSPAHLLANGSFVVGGATLAVGALLLWSGWPRVRQGRIAMGFIAMSGILVIAVGLLPWDLYPLAHDNVALFQAVAQWIGMIVLNVAVRGRSGTRRIGTLTLVCVTVSLAGFVLFVDASYNGPSASLGLGITERIAFDTLSLWSAAVGLVLMTKSDGTPRSPCAAPAPASDV